MQYVKHGLLFTTLCLLLSMAHVVTPELSSGETIIQWVWFGKVLPFTAGSIIAVCLMQLYEGVPLRKALGFPYFFIYFSWSLMFFGMVETVWGNEATVWFYGFGTFSLCVDWLFFQSWSLCRIFGNDITDMLISLFEGAGKVEIFM